MECVCDWSSKSGKCLDMWLQNYVVTGNNMWIGLLWSSRQIRLLLRLLSCVVRGALECCCYFGRVSYVRVRWMLGKRLKYYYRAYTHAQVLYKQPPPTFPFALLARPPSQHTNGRLVTIVVG